MSEETIVRQAAPTLAGIKTGSMFPYRYESREELLEDIRAFNRIFVPRGMCLLLLRVMEKSALLYLYRPQSLEKDLKDSVSQEVLQESGYACESCAACVLVTRAIISIEPPSRSITMASMLDSILNTTSLI